MLHRALAWIATAAGLVFIVVLATGGFRIDVGPVRVSAHGVLKPLLWMALSGAALAWLGAARTADAFAAITAFVTRHALAVGLVAAAAVVWVGVHFGTFAASSSDASAYVSHSALIDGGRLTFDEPLARAVDWHEATWTFTPLGYRPGPAPGILVPGYPLGLPIVMAAAGHVAGEVGPYVIVPALAALAVLATYALAARFGSPRAGMVAAVLLASSPIVQFQTVQPMSDVAAMAWWTLAAACAMRRTLPAAAGAGALAGMALLTRPNLAPLAAIIAAVATGWPRTVSSGSLDVRRFVLFLAALTPSVAALAMINWSLYGSPLRSGYGDVSDFFAAANIGPNVGGYTRRILAGEGPALMLAVVTVAMLAVYRRRTLSPSVAPLVKVAAAETVVLLAIYLPYGVFPDWSSLRFLLPAFPLAFAVLGGLVSEALDRMPLPARGAALLAALTLVVLCNVPNAMRESVYFLQDYEARYRTVGRYLASSLPTDAVIVTSQESGSAHYYTGRPVLRWDLLAVDLETAIARLRALGRHPVLVVEDWEKPALRQRFPSGPTASLDWTPRAEAGRLTRVGVWDPLDRGSRVVTERLP